jgi:hypothetical protein
VGKRVLEEHREKDYLRECLSSAGASVPLLRKSQACIFKLIFEWGKYLGFSLSRGNFVHIPKDYSFETKASTRPLI